jgi:hypothetical protein
MNGEDDMPNSDPPEILTTDDFDDEPILDAGALASMLARADGRSGDQGHIDYLTAINEVISTDAVTQMDGVARLGQLLGHPAHSAAAQAVLEGFLSEAESESRAGDGLSPSAALLAKDLLSGPAPAPRPVPKPSPEPAAETLSAAGASPVERPPGRPGNPAHHRGRATAALLSRAMRGRWLLWHAALGAAALAGLGNLGYAMAVEKIAGRPGHHPAGLTTVLCVAAGIVALALLRAGGVYLSRVLTERAHIDLAAADRRRAVDAYLARPQAWTDRRERDSALDVVQGNRERVWYAATALPFAVGTVIAALVAVAVAWNADPFAGAAVGAGLAAVAALTLRELNSVTASSEQTRELTAGRRHRHRPSRRHPAGRAVGRAARRADPGGRQPRAVHRTGRVGADRGVADRRGADGRPAGQCVGGRAGRRRAHRHGRPRAGRGLADRRTARRGGPGTLRPAAGRRRPRRARRGARPAPRRARIR